MTGPSRPESGRTARIRTTLGDEAIARRVVASLRPDNTAEMRTVVEDGDVVTTIERKTTGSLRSTADDYVVNLRVAVALEDFRRVDEGTAEGRTDGRAASERSARITDSRTNDEHR